ncbi:hypothetical protein DDI_2190 [Dickeya dianthicola RNS04.9]|nr:hypothetical protein DDI_2190 [Dickeya dianthicola RNS04.9]
MPFFASKNRLELQTFAERIKQIMIKVIMTLGYLFLLTYITEWEPASRSCHITTHR